MWLAKIPNFGLLTDDPDYSKEGDLAGTIPLEWSHHFISSLGFHAVAPGGRSLAAREAMMLTLHLPTMQYDPKWLLHIFGMAVVSAGQTGNCHLCITASPQPLVVFPGPFAPAQIPWTLSYAWDRTASSSWHLWRASSLGASRFLRFQLRTGWVWDCRGCTW